MSEACTSGHLQLNQNTVNSRILVAGLGGLHWQLVHARNKQQRDQDSEAGLLCY